MALLPYRLSIRLAARQISISGITPETLQEGGSEVGKAPVRAPEPIINVENQRRRLPNFGSSVHRAERGLVGELGDGRHDPYSTLKVP